MIHKKSEKNIEVEKYVDQYFKETNRVPSYSEIADNFGISKTAAYNRCLKFKYKMDVLRLAKSPYHKLGNCAVSVLQAVLSQLNHIDEIQSNKKTHEQVIAHLTAENTKLKEALEKIKQLSTKWGYDSGDIDQFNKISTQALTNPNPPSPAPTHEP